MKLDLGSIIFNMDITSPGNTPQWGTSFGQGKNYYIKKEYEEIITGMVYSAVDTKDVWCALKGENKSGGGDEDKYFHSVTSVFNKVYVNGKLIPDGQFILAVIKELAGVHSGRKQLKYNRKMTYKGKELNEDCIKKICETFEMSDDAAWFVDEINIYNQDELHFKAYFLNSDGPLQFNNADERKEYILECIKEYDCSLQDKDKAKGGFNKIFYGAPGCGKSHYVSQMLKAANVKKENIFRVTFHPEYMNCDFVGQILPSVTEEIDESTGKKREIVKYEFNAGPFTLALQRAYQTSDMVYLIIEEINRGNAAAIFGDLFQLLDRVKDVNSIEYSMSEYPIRNVGVQDYIVREGDVDYLIEKEVEDVGITIPGNLTILATMNSSDQNVFTLDTAFKRRWLFEQISNDIESDSEHKYKNWYIPGTDVTWEKFLVKLNDEILNYKVQNQTNEDKRLGKYFVTQECLTETIKEVYEVEDIAENFAYKVLEYVWNDVCKIGRDDWFDTEKYRTLEDLIDVFMHPKVDGSPLDVFQNIDFRE